MGRKGAEVTKILKDGAYVDAKECNTCKIIKPLFDFSKNKACIGGVMPTCRSCRSTKRRAEYVSLKDVVLQNMTVDGAEVTGKKCSNCEELKPLDDFSVNKYGLGERSYRCKECDKTYREENKELIASQKKKWYLTNKDSVDARIETWRKRNREMFLKSRIRRANRRRAKKQLLISNLSKEDWESIEHRFGNKCALTENSSYDLEHFIPLSWGHGGTYLGNVYPLSSSENQSKSDKNPFQWASENNFSGDKWNDLIKWLAQLNGLTKDEFVKFVYWCEENKRTIDQIRNDGIKSSIELWKEGINNRT